MEAEIVPIKKRPYSHMLRLTVDGDVTEVPLQLLATNVYQPAEGELSLNGMEIDLVVVVEDTIHFCEADTTEEIDDASVEYESDD